MTGIFQRTGHDIWQTNSIPKYAHELEHPIEIEDISLRNDADIDPAAVNVKSNIVTTYNFTLYVRILLSGQTLSSMEFISAYRQVRNTVSM
jgi:hypothetical protein